MMIPHLLADKVLQQRRLQCGYLALCRFQKKQTRSIVPVTDWIYSFSQNTMRITKIYSVSESVLHTLLSFFRTISFYLLLFDFIAYRRLSSLQVRRLHLYVLRACMWNFAQNFVKYSPHWDHGHVTIFGRSQ